MIKTPEQLEKTFKTELENIELKYPNDMLKLNKDDGATPLISRIIYRMEGQALIGFGQKSAIPNYIKDDVIEAYYKVINQSNIL